MIELRRSALLLVLCCSILQCGGGAAPEHTEIEAEGGVDAEAEGDVVVEVEADFFDEQQPLRLELEVDPADWSAVQAAEDDGIGASANPSYVKARLKIGDGDVFVEDVSLRRKGDTEDAGSAEPPLDLKLDFDESINRVVGGVRKLNLHADALANQHVAYGIWRDAGYAAPRTGWVNLVVNGRELGLYLAVEQIDEVFTGAMFGTGPERALYKARRYADLEAGVLWRSTLEYLGDTLADDPYLEAKAGVTDPAAFVRLTAALTSGTASEIEEVLDVDRAVSYLALDVATRGTPYFVHDFYVFESEPGRFVLLPWDMDWALTQPVQSLCGLENAGVPATAIEPRGVLAERLLSDPESFARYLDELTRLVSDPTILERRAERLARAEALIPSVNFNPTLASTLEQMDAQLMALIAVAVPCPSQL